MKSRTEEPSTAEDRALIETIEAALRPEPMNAGRAAEFRRTVEERLGRPATPWTLGRVTLAATAAIAALLWFSLPEAPAPVPAPVENPIAETVPVRESEPILHAYADPDVYDEAMEPEQYLPEEYLALASLFEIGA